MTTVQLTPPATKLNKLVIGDKTILAYSFKSEISELIIGLAGPIWYPTLLVANGGSLLHPINILITAAITFYFWKKVHLYFSQRNLNCRISLQNKHIQVQYFKRDKPQGKMIIINKDNVSFFLFQRFEKFSIINVDKGDEEDLTEKYKYNLFYRDKDKTLHRLISLIPGLSCASELVHELNNFVGIEEKEQSQSHQIKPAKVLKPVSEKLNVNSSKKTAFSNDVKVNFGKNKLEFIVKWMPRPGIILANGFISYIFFHSYFQKDFLEYWIYSALPIGLLFHLRFYYGICSFFNNTYITINKNSNFITVENKPLPWIIQKEKFLISDIKQLYVTRINANLLQKFEEDLSEVWKYSVQFIDFQNNVHVLVGNILYYEEALMVEQHIEEFLEIQDLLVKQEYVRQEYKKVS